MILGKIFVPYLTQSDDLGRVVVPKEIRRTLRIREGDPLEIFTDREGEIILKKYSPIGELGAFAQQYAECLAQTTGHMVCVTDRDGVVADKKFIPFVKETTEGVYAETICPIISEGDAIGAVVLAGRDERSKMSETEQKLAATAAVF
ncbi:MAG: AbrB/MazE/SpoVT family DNA-binding domain-containing protein, partial [Lachnospiraceae bacterium]|nr:AbrB/MazE/SpoVT family DNA-binding domain-containing protein [Lachnospiraceae bacterium]